MKIGLLSYHKNYNYGWNLQCYALLTTLKNMGYEVTLIDKRKFPKNNFTSIIKNVLKDILILLKIKEKQKSYEEKQELIGHNIASFFDTYICPKSCEIYNKEDYKKLLHFDAFIVGSDQVWRPSLVNPISDYYFSFVDYPAKFISYAASFGVDFGEYNVKEQRICGKLIERFTAVSVREESGIKLIKDVYNWNCNPILMPDPTLLLSKNDYEKIILNSKDLKRNTELFCYILDKTEDKTSTIDFLSKNLSLQPHYINFNENQINPSVEEWLNSFMNAKFIFTDSFHGCVFSLIFRKPFIAYGNIQRGIARFTSLLNTFQEQNRLIKSSTDINTQTLSNLSIIDIEKIDKIQNNLREKAINFFRSNLS